MKRRENRKKQEKKGVEFSFKVFTRPAYQAFGEFTKNSCAGLIANNK
jgi:hypothetical protein